MKIPHSLYDEIKLPESEPGVRILSLTTENGQIKGSLRAVPLSSNPNYTALSYTWQSSLPYGSQSETFGSISIQDFRCRIRKNLHNALVRLGECQLWVDAICINQESDEEKARQVRLMGEIYSRAEKVIVWLGNADEHSSKAAELIRCLGQLQREDMIKIRHETLSEPGVKSLLPRGLDDESYWRALAHFFCRPWFSRAWIMQEVILAKDIVVYCGFEEFDWTSIRRVSGHLAQRWHRTFQDEHFTGITGAAPYLNAAAKLGSTREDVERLKNRSEGDLSDRDLFLDTLIRAREFQSQDPRDKVYSCYGIGLRFRPQGFHFPLPQYGKDFGMRAAFTQTARAILEMSNNLHMLAYAESLQATEMPSWVPDWTVPDKVGLGITGYQRYWAADTLRQQVLFVDKEEEILRLRAFRVGYVDAVGNTKKELRRGSDLTQTRDLLRGLIRRRRRYDMGLMTMAERRTRTERRIQTVEEAFWRTIIQNTGLDSACPADESAGMAFRAWLSARQGGQPILDILDDDLNHEYILSTIVASTREPGGLAATNGDAETQHKKHISEPTTIPTSHDFDSMFCLRQCLRVFRTDRQSNYIGVGAEAVNVGDSIWVVPGSRVPLIIREQTSRPNSMIIRCKLVGAAYVHGIMHGQTIMRRPSVDLQTILEIA